MITEEFCVNIETRFTVFVNGGEMAEKKMLKKARRIIMTCRCISVEIRLPFLDIWIIMTVTSSFLIPILEYINVFQKIV